MLQLLILGVSSPLPQSVLKNLTDSDQLLQHRVTFRQKKHGMTPEFLDQVRNVTKQFYAIPVEEKKKYLRSVDDTEGYGSDKVFSELYTHDWTDRLYLTVHPPDQRRLKFWPENPKSFRDTIEQYTSKLRVIAETVLKGMALSLNLEEDCFVEKYGEQRKMEARFCFYPPCPRPDHVFGVRPQADKTIITILLPDKEVEGLQLLKDGQWFRPPIVPEVLLINVADQAEILANGLFKSVVHKVVTNAEKERISVAAFCVLDSEMEIEPFESLISDSMPRLHKSVKNYAGTYVQYYQQGTRAIEALKI